MFVLRPYTRIPLGYLNDLGSLQTHRSCVLLLDVTENCNLNCPTCFAESGRGRVASSASITGCARSTPLTGHRG